MRGVVLPAFLALFSLLGWVASAPVIAVSAAQGASPGLVRQLEFRQLEVTSGAWPNAVTTGDFNGDDRPDIAVVNEVSGSVSIFLSQRDGTFSGPVEYRVGLGPNSVIAADLNGDGKLDLAVAIAGEGKVAMLLGKGDGTFQDAISYSAGGSPNGIVTGDFNGDGKLDLAVVNSCAQLDERNACSDTAGTVSVLLGNGDGTFQSPTRYATGVKPTGIVAGDLNRDGKVDLATANFSCTGLPCPAGSVSVLLGNGDGTFGTHVEYGAGGGPTAVSAGDFDGDGILDLAVVNHLDDSVSILRGNGDGTFQRHADYAAGNGALRLVVADLNGDGKADLAVTNWAANSVSVLLGNGDGSFQPRAQVRAGIAPSGVAASDINLDGRTDLVVTNTMGNTVSVLLNQYSTDTTPGPAVSLSTTTVDFGNQPVQITSAPATVTLTNSGTATLHISSVRISGVPAGDFALVSPATTCNAGGNGAIVPPMTSCAIVISFTPADFGPRNATVTITDDASPDGTPTTQTISLKGTGSSPMPIVSLSQTSVSFGNQAVGTSSAPATVTVKNIGTATLHISSVVIGGTNPGDFPLVATSTTCSNGAIVQPTGTCAVVLVFTPAAMGARSAALTITDDASPAIQTIGLTGGVAAVGPGVNLSPSTVSFGNQGVGVTGAAMNVTLKNTGNGNLDIASVVPGGPNASEFTVAAGTTCTNGFTLAADATCLISVAFKPAGTGVRVGTLFVSDNAPGSPQTVTLTGTGVDFAVSGSPSGATVSAGQSANYTITITPAAGGFSEAVTFSATGTPAATTVAFNPSSVTPGNNSATTVMTITTTARSASPPQISPDRQAPGPVVLLWVAASMLALIILAQRHLGTRTRCYALCLPMALLMLIMVLVMGCGGGGGRDPTPALPPPPPPVPVSGTPAGTYIINVTAASGGVSHGTSVMLTVN